MKRFLLLGLCSAALLHATPQPEAAAQDGGSRVRLQRRARVMQHAMLLGDARHSGVSHLRAPTTGTQVWKRKLSGPIIASPAADAEGNTWWSTQAGQVHILDIHGGEIARLTLEEASHSSPALLRDGTAILATRSGQVLRVNATGKRLWSATIGKEILSSPALDEDSGRVYISTQDQTLALDLKSGAIIFRYTMGNRANNSSPAMGLDGLVRVVNWKGRATALAGSGTPVWTTPLPLGTGFLSSPAIDRQSTMYTAGAQGRLFSLDAQGRMRWSRNLKQPVNAFLALTPQDHVVVPGMRDLMVVSPNGDIDWSLSLQGQRLSSNLAVSRDGVILFGTGQGQVWAVSPQGTRLWSYQMPGPIKSAPVLIETHTGQARVVVATMNGDIVCLR